MKRKKMKIIKWKVLLILAVIIHLSYLISAECIDESQTNIDIAYGIMPTDARAQSFKIDDGEWIYRIDFYYEPGDLGYLICCLDDDLNPKNGNLTEHIFDVSSWTAGWHTWNIRNISGDVEVSAGTTYYLILTPLGLGTSGGSWYGADSDPDQYPNGEAYLYHDDTWSSLGYGKDYAFIVYTDVNPVASFTYYTDLLTIYTNASSSYTPDGDPITSYQWDWNGDGIWDDTGITANHTYSLPGTYTVQLKVTDEDGHIDIQSKQITVSSNQPPIANFTYSPENITINETVHFTDLSYDPDGSIINWTWNFGDGNYSYEQNPSHVYENAGHYDVTLTVTDNSGGTNSTTKTITVSEKNENGSSWFTWKLPFSWFAIFLTAFTGICGFSLSAFFLKPESIKALGYAPAAGSILTTILLIAVILMYHAGVAWYYIALIILLIIFILYITIKVVISKKGRKFLRKVL